MLSSRTFCDRPSPHYAPVSKHKEMRPRLGWTISYKSLYFVHPSLDLMPLFTGMRERSIILSQLERTLLVSNLSLYNYQQQGLYSFELSKFHDFPGLFEFPKTLGLAVTLKNFRNFPCFRVFLDFKQFNKHKLWCSPKCVIFGLLKNSFLCLFICSN